jgi:hypothetical protein
MRSRAAAILLTLLLVLTSTANSGPLRWKWETTGCQYEGARQSAHVTYTVSYTNVQAGPIHIKAANGAYFMNGGCSAAGSGIVSGSTTCDGGRIVPTSGAYTYNAQAAGGVGSGYTQPGTNYDTSGGTILSTSDERSGCPEPAVLTDVEVTIALNIGSGAAPSAQATFTGKVVVPPHSKSHNVGLKINGGLVGTGTATQINSTNTSEATYGSNQTVRNGDTFEWTVDGFGQGVTTVQLTALEGGAISYGPVVFESTVPGGDAPTPTPARTATPTPTATATPYVNATPQANGSPPNPQVIVQPGPGGSGSVNTSAVTVTNPQDIYAPLLDALKNKGGGARQADIGTMVGPRGNLDQLADKNADNIAKINGAATQAKNMVTDAGNKFQGWQTASFGTVSTIDLPLNAFNNAFPASVAVPPFFSLIRRVILWLLVALWYYTAVRYVIALKVA